MITREAGKAVIFCLILILFSAFEAEAAVQNIQLIGTHELSEDLEIVIPAGTLNDLFRHGAISTASGETILAGDGIQVSIDVVRPMGNPEISGVINSGIFNDGGEVNIDKLYITVGREADRSMPEFKDSRSFGIQVRNGGNITIGDDADVYSLSDGIALSARRGSSISIGDNAILYGNISSRSMGTVLSYRSDVTIGHNAIISNDGYSELGGSSEGEFADSHVAVNTEFRGKITIGNNATISSYAAGAHNHAVVTGTTLFNDSTGTVVIGDRAKIIASGDNNSYGLYSMLEGSSIKIGADSSVTTYGKDSYGAFARRGGRIEIGDGSNIVTNDNNSTGLRALMVVPSGDISVITTGNGVTIETKGISSNGVAAFANSVKRAEVTLGKDNKVVTAGVSAHGLLATSRGAQITLGAGSSVTTIGSNAHAVYAFDGGVIKMEGATIKVDHSSHAVFANNTGSGDSSLITGDGKFTISGDIVAHTTSTGRRGST